MINKNISKLAGDEKGVSLIMAFFIMIIVLSVVLSVSALLYSEVKVIRNISNSIISFYAADSGIEKVLFYDRQVLVIGTDGKGKDVFAPRGLCSMLLSSPPFFCTPTPGSPFEYSIYCDSTNPNGTGTDCNINTCTNCTISFDTKFDAYNDKTYSVEASVKTTSNPSADYYLIVKSDGAFADTGRQVQITILKQQ